MSIKRVKLSDGKIIELDIMDDDNTELAEMREELVSIQKKLMELLDLKPTPDVKSEIEETKADLKKSEKTFLQYLKGE